MQLGVRESSRYDEGPRGSFVMAAVEIPPLDSVATGIASPMRNRTTRNDDERNRVQPKFSQNAPAGTNQWRRVWIIFSNFFYFIFFFKE